ncbi:MAG: cytidylate kinase-like family protein [Clostridiales bacterium]|nr:cytidylate kinase-like family protein [Clostridiales bacterium]
MKHIITIGRQFGSGGHEIGEKLAEKLGVNFYDKDILQSVARNTGVCEAILSESDESASNSLLYSLVMNTRTEPFEEKMAKYEVRYLRQQVEKGSCVIIGRRANYLFRDDPALLSVFITAPIENRIDRIMERYGLDAKAAQKLISSTDKKRASYYYYRTDQRWTDLNQYQFILDSSVFGIDGTVEMLTKMVAQREKL